MRKSKFSEHQIIAILKAVEGGRGVKDVCREHEISDATYYQWKSKYGGMEAADKLRDANLTICVLAERYDLSFQPGIIIAQTPSRRRARRLRDCDRSDNERRRSLEEISSSRVVLVQ